MLQNKVAKDIDLSTNATPDEMKTVFDAAKIRYIETGLQHGTLTAHINQKDFEVTCLRADITTNGRHAQVEFVKDWKQDAERRDLTINAMSMEISTRKIYDYFNGIGDLDQRKVVFVGDTRTRIQEDYLRILRYFRFLGRISTLKDIESLRNSSPILAIIKEEASNLRTISSERIWSELKGILIGPNAAAVLRLMLDSNVFLHSSNYFLPVNIFLFPLLLSSNILMKFNSPLVDLQHVNNGLIDRFEVVVRNARTIQTETDRLVDVEPATLLASLFEAPSQFEKSGSALKLSNHEKFLVQFIIAHRNVSSKSSPNLKKYQDLLVTFYKVKELDIIRNRALQLILYENCTQNYIDLSEWNVPTFPINGNQMKDIGLKGKEISLKLEKLKRIWMESNYTISVSELLNNL